MARLLPSARPMLNAVGISEDGVAWMRRPIHLIAGTVELSDAPEYGERTRAILAAIGYEDSSNDELLAAGLIRQAP